MRSEEDFVNYVASLHNPLPCMGGPWHITDHLYLGSMENALNLGYLQELGINSLLNCAATDDVRPLYASPPNVIRYCSLQAEDTLEYSIQQHFDAAIIFLKECHRKRSRVLVYCKRGVNRSATICVAYLVLYGGLTLIDAMRRVFMVKPNVFTNHAFVRKLYTYCVEHNFTVS